MVEKYVLKKVPIAICVLWNGLFVRFKGLDTIILVDFDIVTAQVLDLILCQIPIECIRFTLSC